ncbi:NRDE family protein [Halorussus sp. AFM4]|uniref:NRDE family protein n=1 Tax=Halorussus sp. AFM4 TaxID=3421651 RepID=UPI003EBF83B0
MCTLILAWQVFDGTPVAAAANRDEATGRPSRPPAVLDDDPTVVAPRDEEAGGTWIGYNDAGLFVAVTNRRADIEGERSRGLLVRDALARESAADAAAYVESQLAERDYAGFNLVVADAEQAVLLEWDGVLRTTALDPGVHVVVNEGYDGEAPKSSRIREVAHPADDGTAVEAWFDRVKGVLADHDLGVCVHGEEFGTRSSSLVAVDESGAGRYRFADGRPCETDYEAVAVGEESGGTGVGDAADGQI